MDSMNEEWFIVKDIDGLINSSRALVFNSFGKDNENDDEDSDTLDYHISDKDKEEFDRVLSFEESKTIIMNMLKKQQNKKTRQR
jgi:hypothetical protein